MKAPVTVTTAECPVCGEPVTMAHSIRAEERGAVAVIETEIVGGCSHAEEAREDDAE